MSALPADREPRFAPNVDPRRVAALPSAGRLMTVGALATLLPGIVAYAILRSTGLSNGVAGLLGLAFCFVGMCCYPLYLRRLGKQLGADLDR